MSEYARLVVAVDSTQVARADAAMSKFERTGTSMERQTNSLTGAFARLKGPLAAVTAGFSIKGIIDTADNYGQMADRIKMATSSTEEYRQVQDRLLQSANNTYRPLVEAQELFIRTADSLRSLGNETSDVLDITDSFSYLLVTNAASADRANSAISAYSKSIQSGKIDSDAWQSILAAMPSIVETLARETGKSSAEIRKLGVTGKLSLADLNEGLRQSVEANRALADGMGTTLNDAIVRAKNNFSAYVGESGSVTASSRALSGALDLMSGNIDAVASVMGGVAAGSAVLYANKLLQTVIAAAAARAANIAQAESALQAALADQRAAQSAVQRAAMEARAARGTAVQTQMSIQLAEARMVEAAATSRLAVAQAGMRTASAGLLAVLGGPVGLAVLAGTAAAGYLLFRDATEEVKQSSVDLAAPLDQLIAKWGELDQAQRTTLTRDLKQQIKETKDGMQGIAGEVEAAFYKMGNAKGLPVESWLLPLKDFRQAVEDGGEGIHDFAQQLLEGVPANSEYRKTVEDAAAAIAKKRGEVVKVEEALGAFENRTKTTTGAVATSTDATLKQVAALELQAKTAGMASDQAVIYRLKQDGAIEADLMRAEAALKVVGALEAQRQAIDDQQRVNSEATGIIESLRTEEEAIRASYDRRRETILASSIYTEEQKREALMRLQAETDEQLLQANAGFWERYLTKTQEQLTNLDGIVESTLNNFTGRFGDAFEDVITSSSSVGEAFENLGDAMIRSVINATGQMLAQWAVYEVARMLLAKPGQVGAVAAMTANAEAASFMAGLNSYSSTAAIPIVGPALAPGAAAAAVAATQPMVASVTAAASAGLAGMAHDGIDSIPREGTWLLDKGERVVDRRTNADLKEFLAAGGAGQSSAQPIEVNITIEGNADAATVEQLREVVKGIPEAVRSVIAKDTRMNRMPKPR